MEVGTEISQKIRSAIKAKLMELGSYVDDELPDYIMVMVANKKTKQQMTYDLRLFLGSNTDVFTTWLHGLLVKLQTVSGDTSKKDKTKGLNKKREKHSKSKDSVESKKEKRKASKTGDGDAPETKSARTSNLENDKEESRISISREISTHPSIDLDKPKDINDQSSDNNAMQNTSSTDTNKAGESKSDDVEDVRQLLVTETPGDELAQELETTEIGIEEASMNKPRNIITSGTVKETKDSDNITTYSGRDSDNMTTSIGRESQTELVSPSRKRKCPSSVVTAVRRVVNSDEDEDDKSAPAVASVIKVTSRKSSIPQSMQANSESDILLNKDGPEETDLVNGRLSLDFVKKALSEVIVQMTDKEDDIGAFCKSIERTLRKMTQGDLAISKLKIQKILFDYEMAQHKQTSLEKNLRGLINPPSALSSRGVSCVNKESVDAQNISMAATHSNDRMKQTLCQNSDNNVDKNKSHTESSKEKHSEMVGPNGSQCRPNQKEAVGNIHSPDLRQSLDLKGASNLDSSITVSGHDQQSVTTAVSSTVMESSGFDSPSSSHLCNSVPIKWSASSVNNKKKFSAVDSVQRANNQGLHPTVLVSTLHQNRRLGPDSPSVLRNPLSHDSPSISKNSQFQSGEDIPDSSKEISPEQLKVLAKNLKITVVNKRALRPEDKSNSDDSTSDESEDESDSEDEESDEETIGEGTDVSTKHSLESKYLSKE